MLSLLQARRDWPGALLAERLGVSPRTVRRDVDRLRELGYPVQAVKGPDGGYRLDAGKELPPLLFDDEQAVALAIALQTAAATGACIEEAAERALNTVRQVMPARLRRRIDLLRIAAVDRPSTRSNPQVDNRVLMTLGAAVHAREELRFDYTPASGEATATPRRAQPHHLVTWEGRWYLVAWDLDRHDWRTFRADRITPRIPTGPRFTPRELPGGDVAAFVASKFRGSGGSGDWPCRGEVILDLPAAVVSATAGTESSRNSARIVADSSWVRGRGTAWRPPSADSTPISRSSGRTSSGKRSRGWPGGMPTPRRVLFAEPGGRADSGSGRRGRGPGPAG